MESYTFFIQILGKKCHKATFSPCKHMVRTHKRRKIKQFTFLEDKRVSFRKTRGKLSAISKVQQFVLSDCDVK